MLSLVLFSCGITPDGSPMPPPPSPLFPVAASPPPKPFSGPPITTVAVDLADALRPIDCDQLEFMLASLEAAVSISSRLGVTQYPSELDRLWQRADSGARQAFHDALKVAICDRYPEPVARFLGEAGEGFLDAIQAAINELGRTRSEPLGESRSSRIGLPPG